MVVWLPRSAWDARPAEAGPGPLLAYRVEGIADHWPGMAKSIDATGDAGFARIASALRGWQNYHMDVRGWSDIAYQGAVDQVGRAWTLRGLNIQSGANGNLDVNQRFGALLLILGPGEQPSAAMTKTVREIHYQFKQMFSGSRIRPYGHRDVRPSGTDCPGDPAYAAITSGKFDAAAPVAPSGGTTVTATNDQILSAVQSLDAEESQRYIVYSNRYQDTTDRLNLALEKLDAFILKLNTLQADVTQIKDDVDKLTTP